MSAILSVCRLWSTNYILPESQPYRTNSLSIERNIYSIKKQNIKEISWNFLDQNLNQSIAFSSNRGSIGRSGGGVYH